MPYTGTGPFLWLIEYRWRSAIDKYTRKGWTEGDWVDGIGYNGSASYLTRIQNHVFNFIPRPSSIRKNIQMNWRVSHSGTQSFKKARFRGRETTELRLSGAFSESLRKEFEYYLKQESKFWLLESYMDCPHTEGHDFAIGDDDPDGWFVIIKSANFSGSEGGFMDRDFNEEHERARRVNYEIILERVERSDLEWV